MTLSNKQLAALKRVTIGLSTAVICACQTPSRPLDSAALIFLPTTQQTFPRVVQQTPPASSVSNMTQLTLKIENLGETEQSFEGAAGNGQIEKRRRYLLVPNGP